VGKVNSNLLTELGHFKV